MRGPIHQRSPRFGGQPKHGVQHEICDTSEQMGCLKHQQQTGREPRAHSKRKGPLQDCDVKGRQLFFFCFRRGQCLSGYENRETCVIAFGICVEGDSDRCDLLHSFPRLLEEINSGTPYFVLRVDFCTAWMSLCTALRLKHSMMLGICDGKENDSSSGYSEIAIVFWQ